MIWSRRCIVRAACCSCWISSTSLFTVCAGRIITGTASSSIITEGDQIIGDCGRQVGFKIRPFDHIERPQRSGCVERLSRPQDSHEWLHFLAVRRTLLPKLEYYFCAHARPHRIGGLEDAEHSRQGAIMREAASSTSVKWQRSEGDIPRPKRIRCHSLMPVPDLGSSFDGISQIRPQLGHPGAHSQHAVLQRAAGSTIAVTVLPVAQPVDGIRILLRNAQSRVVDGARQGVSMTLLRRQVIVWTV